MNEMPMERDLKKIKALLEARFPKCEVAVHNRKGDAKCGPSNTASVSVFFPSIGDELCVMETEGLKEIGMFVCEHVREEDFKPDGYDISSLEYKTPELLVEQMALGAEMMLEKCREFEKEENDALADWSTPRSQLDPELSSALEAEIMA